MDTGSLTRRPTVAGFARLHWFDIECADPHALAEFYRQVLGWEVTHCQNEAAVITDGSTCIRFGRVEGYEPPGWPVETTPRPTGQSVQSQRLPSHSMRNGSACGSGVPHTAAPSPQS